MGGEGINKDCVNATELLIMIREDIGIVKNEMTHMNRDIQELKETSQNNDESLRKRIVALEQEVSLLKAQKDREDATKYRRALQFTLTGFGGMLVAKFPDIFKVLFPGKGG